MSNVVDIKTGQTQSALTNAEQVEIVRDMFEELIIFIQTECPTLPDMGIDASFDAVLGYIDDHDARQI
jgi:hypothetical protein